MDPLILPLLQLHQATPPVKPIRTWLHASARRKIFYVHLNGTAFMVCKILFRIIVDNLSGNPQSKDCRKFIALSFSLHELTLTRVVFLFVLSLRVFRL